MLDWALQLTFFLGCFVLTERRIDAQRYDCLCCLKRPTSETAPPDSAPRKPVGLMSGNKDTGLQALLDKHLLPALLHPVGRALMLALVVGLSVVGAVGITRLREGLPLGDLAPDDHYYRDFDRKLQEFGKVSDIGALTECDVCAW
jgi:hypothetical protein